MPVPFLATHQDTALALYQQRCIAQQQALTDAQVMARHEQQLWTHLHVLSHSAPLEGEPDTPAEHFVDLASRMLCAAPQVQSAGYDRALTLLQGDDESARQGAFDALALLPPAVDDSRMLDLYRQEKALRPLLFDLWREQGRVVPAALISVAELRGHETALQIAALRYAASQPAIGLEPFPPYYQGLLSGGGRPEKSGHLLATALWGGLLRGERKLAKPLWRCIESESDPASLYHLLRLGALLADPELIPLLRHYADQQPDSGAELLALHGTEPALLALLELSQKAEVPAGVMDAWQWVSGRELVAAPHLRLVAAEQTAPPAAPNSLDHWWQQHRDLLADGQRLLLGAPLSPEHLFAQCYRIAGRASHNLLDLLSYTTGAPLGVSANAVQLQRRQILAQRQRAVAPRENPA